MCIRINFESKLYMRKNTKRRRKIKVTNQIKYYKLSEKKKLIIN